MVSYTEGAAALRIDFIGAQHIEGQLPHAPTLKLVHSAPPREDYPTLVEMELNMIITASRENDQTPQLKLFNPPEIHEDFIFVFSQAMPLMRYLR